MFDALVPQQADKIIRLMQMFRDDPREGKIDLGVGVFRDAQGRTPVMRAVKAAEARILAAQDTKSYVALAGDPAFLTAMRHLILGDTVPAGRIAAAAMPGGTGAVRQVFELVRRANPGATVWISDPTWANHPSILATLAIPVRTYRYYDSASGGLDLPGMLADLDQAARGDLVLLHGCCHNPTGADLTLADWSVVADLLGRRGAVPFVDLAYQGFGEGVEADAAGLRVLAAHLPEVLIAASCSKNFGLYRERVGVVLAVCADAGTQRLVQGTLAWLNRQSFAFPPDHGARVVTTILEDDALRADWLAELGTMRAGMDANRAALAAALRTETGSDRFGFLAAHRGMFSLLGLTEAEVAHLRTGHGIYMVDDSRLNIAGLTAATIPIVARAVASLT